MKKFNILYGLTCLFFYCLCASVRADTVTILADEWYPMNGSPNASNPGYMVEVAQQILEAHGHTLDYRLVPWKRSIIEVRKGNADCIFGAYKTDAIDFIFPAESLGKVEFTFYAHHNFDWTYQGLDSLSSIRLGVISGYSYSPEIDNYIKKNRNRPSVQLMTGEKALEKNIRKLMANRIDVIVEFEQVMREKLMQLELVSKLKSVGSLIPAEYIYIACSPNKESSSYYTQLFSQGILSLRKSGELKKILDKYGLRDWQLE